MFYRCTNIFKKTKSHQIRNLMKARSDFKSSIAILLFSCIGVIVIFYIYSRSTSPENDVFISHALYNFAIIVLASYFVCISLLIIGFLSALFSKGNDKDDSKLIAHLKAPFKEKRFALVFGLSSIIYFTFFGFLTNMFILFDNEGNVISLIPSSLGLGSTHHNSMDHSSINHQSARPSSHEVLQAEDAGLHAATHPQHQTLVIKDKDNESGVSDELNQISYPGYRIIICCNNFGYVPMLTIYINSNFSFLLIPLNFFLGIIISVLVGLNVSLNLFVIKRLSINIKSLSKGNVFGSLGLSTGLLIGCPTCAGSLLYSIAGFSSLIAFSSLSLYQIFFIVLSIPFLIISLFIMTKLLRTNICNIRT